MDNSDIKSPAAQQYEETLATVREQFRIMESMSAGNRASWYKEVEHLLNLAKTDNAVKLEID